MIENILIRKQTPSNGKFLFRFDETTNCYSISQCVYLGKSDTEWDECDETQKAEFEAHNEKIEKERLEEYEKQKSEGKNS